MSLYFAGKDAYNSGNYEAAQNYFDEALTKDENIEAKAQNIKYMLGVSAFNNRDYKTAKTYLNLFKDNPIAKDLLLKIEVYEKTLPEDFLYHNDNSNVQDFTAATNSELLSTDQIDSKSKDQRILIIIIVTTLVVTSLSVFFEIKRNLFSKIALRLVGISSESMIVRAQENTKKVDKNRIERTDQEVEMPTTDQTTTSLLETPFDEEIDIEKMASKEIKEISRFFEDDVETQFNQKSSDISENQIHQQSDQEEENDGEFVSARDSILNSILADEENFGAKEEEEKDTSANNNEDKTEEISKKPRYEHLDNIPDDFNVNEAIEKAFKLIEESSRLQAKQDLENETEQFKTIEEMEKEIEEKEKVNLNYFQEMEEIDDKSLESFFDYVFEEHLEEPKKR